MHTSVLISILVSIWLHIANVIALGAPEHSSPINTFVKRTIDISTAITRLTLEITGTGLESRTYLFAVPEKSAPHLAHFYASINKTKLSVTYPVLR